MDWFAKYRPMPVDDLPPPPLEQVVSAPPLDSPDERPQVRVAEVDGRPGVEPVVVLPGERAGVATDAGD